MSAHTPQAKALSPRALDPTTTRLLLEATADQAAVIDSDCVIVATNHAWREFARQNGARVAAVDRGISYLEVCRDDGQDPEVALVRSRLAEVVAGERSNWRHLYPCHSPREQRWFLLRAGHLEGGGALVVHSNVTALKLAEQAAEQRCAHDPLTGALSGYGLWKVLVPMQASPRAPQIQALALDASELRDAVEVTSSPAAGAPRSSREQRDGLIRELGRRLRAAVPPHYAVARLGEDEWVVVTQELEAAAATTEAARLRGELMAAPIELADDTAWRVVCRAAPFVVPRPLGEIEQVLTAARRALALTPA